MKKIFTIAFVMCLTAGAALAQSNDSLERAKQQEALLKQQQKEQQELQKQQQKEQADLLKEQQKAAEKAQKDQAKAEQKALKDEADRQKREEAKAANEARAEQKKLEKKQKRAQHLAEWGRKNHFTADILWGPADASVWFQDNSLYSATGQSYGIEVNYHYPIRKKWDLNIGLGYYHTYLSYEYASVNKDAECSALGGTPQTVDNIVYFCNMPRAEIYTFQVPIKLSHVGKNNRELYFGIAPGYNFSSNFTYNVMTGNKVTLKGSVSNPKMFNNFRCDLILGTQRHKSIFSPGLQLYFNLAPTYVANVETEGRIHEFGIRLAL